MHHSIQHYSKLMLLNTLVLFILMSNNYLLKNILCKGGNFIRLLQLHHDLFHLKVYNACRHFLFIKRIQSLLKVLKTKSVGHL